MTRADFIWMDGHMAPWNEAQVHPMSHSMHYGTAFFEGIRAYDTPTGPVVFRHREHMQRLKDSAKIYRFTIPYSVDELMGAARAVLNANNLKSAYIRPLAYLGEVGMGIVPPESQMSVLIAAFSWGRYLGASAIEEGVDACVASWARSAPNTLPTGAKAAGNYLSSLLIASEARRNGFHEGIALDSRGQVSEGAGQNVFMVKNGVLYTPPATASILPGLTRDAIITLAREEGIEIVEAPIAREALYIADEIFFSGTAAEISPVRSIDRLAVGNGKPGPMTQLLQQRFFGLFTGQTQDKWGWLDPVEVKHAAA
ncbi:branched-chain amino acid transaminase [Gallaecimonas xiamenensis]|uniref:Branched-chain-amino-acid aminotransferase n=1 Tax=Gallaecimonas xiamenensis 3-C-1 TaxID=745411 RepID=K2J4K4_9GAMM|nr:branched-chain amino acid transaminase [Gallaecimonas xiamenensis]EKE77966.1 branched-chain amino acid aminotransferase [Gallaecimonas xiamenensis 3-C-1]